MVRRALAQTITFFAIDSSSPPTRKTGLTFVSGDAKVSKDGGAFASTANVPVEIGSTGRYSLALTAAELDCIWLHVTIEKATMQPQDVVGATSGHPSGAAVTGTLGATTFTTNLVSAVTDFWKDALLVFTSGALAGQVKKVVGYNGATKAITLASALTAAPANGDLFVLINI